MSCGIGRVRFRYHIPPITGRELSKFRTSACGPLPVQASGIERHAYLTAALQRNAARLEHFEAMLPWNVKAELSASR
jgi:hypothetical protein